MKYTKGNWEATPFEVIIERQTTIADCCLGKRRQPDMSLEEIEANAHLIAAAPVMYEALKNLQEYAYLRNDLTISDIREIIDKALRQAEGK